MTDQELADAIRQRFWNPENTIIYETLGALIADFVHQHPQWQPKWGDKVRHGAAREPRTYIAPHPRVHGRSILIDNVGAAAFATTANLKPWTDNERWPE